MLQDFVFGPLEREGRLGDFPLKQKGFCCPNLLLKFYESV